MRGFSEPYGFWNTYCTARSESVDRSRDPCASDAVVAGAKRAIDRLNLGRHLLMQQIDVVIAAALAAFEVALPDILSGGYATGLDV